MSLCQTSSTTKLRGGFSDKVLVLCDKKTLLLHIFVPCLAPERKMYSKYSTSSKLYIAVKPKGHGLEMLVVRGTRVETK